MKANNMQTNSTFEKNKTKQNKQAYGEQLQKKFSKGNEQRHISKRIITTAEGEYLLVMAITKFRLGLPLRTEIKNFVRRNYTKDDFLNYFVDPVAFDAWLLI